MAIRRITKKEETVYNLLEKHSAGRSRCFRDETFDWDEARFKYASWYRRRSIGEFHVQDKDLQICKKEVPELYDSMSNFAKAADTLRKAMDEFTGARWVFNSQARELIQDIRAVYRSYRVLTPQEELIIEQNKDKKGELEAELSKLTLQLEVLPKKGYREERAELKSKIEKVKDILKLL